MAENGQGVGTNEAMSESANTAKQAVNTAKNAKKAVKAAKNAANAVKSVAKMWKAITILGTPIGLIGVGVSFLGICALAILTPGSTSNTPSGENTDAQPEDLETDKGLDLESLDEDDAFYEVANYSQDDQYTYMHSILADAISDAYATTSQKYEANLNSYKNNPDYSSHNGASDSEVFIKDGKYYDSVTGLGTENITYNGDALELRGNTFNDSNNLMDNSNSGAFESGTAYILAAYSVSLGNAAPTVDKTTFFAQNGTVQYTYYQALEKLVNQTDVKDNFFEYSDSLEKKSVTENIKVYGVEEFKEYTENTHTGTTHIYCPDCTDEILEKIEDAKVSGTDDSMVEAGNTDCKLTTTVTKVQSSYGPWIYRTNSDGSLYEGLWRASSAADYNATYEYATSGDYSYKREYSRDSEYVWAGDGVTPLYYYYVKYRVIYYNYTITYKCPECGKTWTKVINTKNNSFNALTSSEAIDYQNHTFDTLITYDIKIRNEKVNPDAEITSRDYASYSGSAWDANTVTATPFTYTEYSYHASISPFSYNELVRKMFLESPIYAHITGGSGSGGGGTTDTTKSVTITASSEQILEQLKAEWPTKMDPRRAKVVETALSGIGNLVYIWGGGHAETGSLSYKMPHPQGVDCSGFVAWAYYNAGITDLGCNIASGYKNQSNTTKLSSASQMLPGDIADSEKHVGIYCGTINGNIVYCHSSGGSANTASNPGLGPCTNSTTFYNYCKYNGFDDTQTYTGSTSGVTPTRDEETTGNFPTYTLSASQLKSIAYVCQCEQGTAKGAAAEASLMANRFEMYGSGSSGSELVAYVRNSTWWAGTPERIDSPGNVSDDVLAAVKDVLVNGRRTLPRYIDEHDCFSDISSATNNGVSISVSNRSSYQQGVTRIHNTYGSTYTFWCFPDSGSDPFGYTDTAAAYKDEYGDTCFSDGTYSGGDSSYDDRFEAIMNSPYYQYYIYYEHDCEHGPSIEQKCPECGAGIKTKRTGFLWLNNEAQYEYKSAEEPDKMTQLKIGDNGTIDTSQDQIITVKEKIQYYVDEIMNSIDAASMYENGSGAWGSGSGSGADIVAVALSQVGNNYSTYCNWYGIQGHWCAMFVSWCANECGYIGSGAQGNSSTSTAFGSDGIIPLHAWTVAGASAFQSTGHWQYASSGYTPNPGDIIYFDWDGGKSISGIDHVGIVEYAENGVVYTIEGNTGGSGGYTTSSVMRKTRSSCIVGYGTPDYPTIANLTGNNNAEKIWNYLTKTLGYTDAGAAGVMGNWQQESGLQPNNVQNSYESKVGSDSVYTAKVDNKTYSKYSFSHDSAGYGLAQWTFWTRKEGMYEFWEQNHTSSISDLGMQLAYYAQEVQSNYSSLTPYLKSVTDVQSAVYQFQYVYEGAGTPAMGNRLSFAQSFYNQYHGK